jgi:glycogen operon protein
VFLNGAALPDPDVHGRPLLDDSFYLLFNGWDQEIDFILPEARWTTSWDVVLDSADGVEEGTNGPPARRPAGGVLRVPGHRLLVLQSAGPPDGQD